MPFWTYMLHCRGGYFYVGHTDDLDRRIAEHQSGLIPGFTADHHPVELVWSDMFPTRDEAKAAENQLKGWSRAKKLALIRGDWDRISELAQNTDSASTSSAQAGRGEQSQEADRPEPVEGVSFTLIPHHQHGPASVMGISARLKLTAHWLTLRWRIEGASKLLVPRFAGNGRQDGLWQSTCFELFVKPEGGAGYTEFNLSPSEQWAVYDFTGYRDGMRDRQLSRAPVCTWRGGSAFALFDAAIPMAVMPRLPASISLTAVLVEEGGTKSYWALAHPPGKPDFHDPACFAASLAPPEGS